MGRLEYNIQTENEGSIAEKILIGNFPDSEALKDQVRKTTDHYFKKG